MSKKPKPKYAPMDIPEFHACLQEMADFSRHLSVELAKLQPPTSRPHEILSIMADAAYGKDFLEVCGILRDQFGHMADILDHKAKEQRDEKPQ